jgi:opacity protein-like surface antigen
LVVSTEPRRLNDKIPIIHPGEHEFRVLPSETQEKDNAMKKPNIILAFILSAFPCVAVADGIGNGVAAPAVVAAPATTNWTGFYAGGQIGYMDYESFATLPPLTGDLIYDGEGLTYGVHAGYLHDFGTYVLGAEVEAVFTDVDKALATGTPAGSVDRNTLVKAKLGYDAGRFLPYFVAGYSWLDTSLAGGAPLDYEGPAYGLGVSYLLTDQFMIGAEILRQNLDGTGTNSQEADVTSATLRASWRF